MFKELISGVESVDTVDKVGTRALKDFNINNLLSGSGTSSKTSSKNSTKAITIQVLVRSLNGAHSAGVANGTGLKLA